MRRLFFLCLMCIVTLGGVKAQGWPANYKGVMLQGFYWDSYKETTWKQLTEQADELSAYFDLIWVPNSGTTSSYYFDSTTTSMGYDPCFWLKHNSCFGTEEELHTMINTFKQKGTGIIEDVVINHKNGLNGWADFPQEDAIVDGKEYKIHWNYTDDAYPEVCQNDEANTSSDSPINGKCTGSKDTGDNFDGFRDLDHTNATVQTNVETYLDYLQNVLGYAGFRYDMVKGYGAQYTRIYNTAANPKFSVGEYWDSKDNIATWIKNNGYTSAAFDFGLKTTINSTFGAGNWDIADKSLAADASLSQYAVTFVDNHDTYRDSSIPLKNNILAANAFILALPGTPCIFWPHWTAYKEELKKMIEARKKAGISNTSKIIRQVKVNGGYVTVVQGENNNIMVISGYPKNLSTDGYTPISVGTTENANYAFYISNTAKNYTIYVKASAAPNLYVWTNDANQTKLNGVWPGTKMSNQKYIGNELYYYTTVTTTASSINCIFNNGSSQTADITGITGDAYYSYDGGKNYNVETPAPAITTLTSQDGTYAYFKAPASLTTVYCWAWDNNKNNFTGGNWPGQTCTIVGQDEDGNNIWLWKYAGQLTSQPTQIIFDGGNNSWQTADLDFVNGGCYTTMGYQYSAVNTNYVNTYALNRSFTKGRYSTICLPFNVAKNEMSQVDGTVYEYTSEADGILHFSNADSIVAYHPYMFIANADGTPLASLNKEAINGAVQTVLHGNFSFTGNIEKDRSLISGNGITYYAYKASDGTFVKAGTTKGMKIQPYRCFFSTTSTVQAKAAVFDNTPTGISTVVGINNITDQRVYNLNGELVSTNGISNRLPKGIYIMNHQKIVIR